MSTSIVTGGAGFLGSHLVEMLAKRGESVIVLDNLSTGRLGNLAGPISSGRVTFVYIDVAVDVTILKGVLKQASVGPVDTIYHLASSGSSKETASVARTADEAQANGTLSLIEIALEKRARFVLASTLEVFGSEPDDFAQEARDWTDTREEPADSRIPRSDELIVVEAVRSRGLDARLARVFNCYGPRMQSSDGLFIPALLEAAHERRALPIYGTGAQTQLMTYIDDAIEVLLLVAGRPQNEFAPVDIGGDDERSVIDIARTLASVVSMEFVTEFVPPVAGASKPRRPDLSWARSLGWVPKTTLEKGLRNTHRWFVNENQIFV